ncbi:MAG: hypothetical protein IT289_10595 [Oligoflexia bacterium]|nr:hypothetical protein [Oligoflexia bacterium]
MKSVFGFGFALVFAASISAQADLRGALCEAQFILRSALGIAPTSDVYPVTKISKNSRGQQVIEVDLKAMREHRDLHHYFEMADTTMEFAQRYPHLSEKFGIEVTLDAAGTPALLRYPSRLGDLNRMPQNGLKFIRVKGQISQREHIQYFRKGLVPLADEGSIHFHDISKHLIGYSLMPKQAVLEARQGIELFFKVEKILKKVERVDPKKYQDLIRSINWDIFQERVAELVDFSSFDYMRALSSGDRLEAQAFIRKFSNPVRFMSHILDFREVQEIPELVNLLTPYRELPHMSDEAIDAHHQALGITLKSP